MDALLLIFVWRAWVLWQIKKQAELERESELEGAMSGLRAKLEACLQHPPATAPAAPQSTIAGALAKRLLSASSWHQCMISYATTQPGAGGRGERGMPGACCSSARAGSAAGK